MTVIEELQALFSGAVHNADPGAAAAFADRLAEAWPELLAEWTREMDRRGGPHLDPFELEVVGFCAIRTSTDNWTLQVFMADADPEDDEPGGYMVRLRGEWHERYAGSFTPGWLTVGPPHRWTAREYQWIAEHLIELAGLPDEIDAAAP